jgi:hypothetical protein
MSSQADHRFECFSVSAVLHEPTRGLGTEEDANTKNE